MEEDIREAIERLNLAQNDIRYATLYSQEEQDKDIQILIKAYKELEYKYNKALSDLVQAEHKNKELNKEEIKT